MPWEPSPTKAGMAHFKKPKVRVGLSLTRGRLGTASRFHHRLLSDSLTSSLMACALGIAGQMAGARAEARDASRTQSKHRSPGLRASPQAFSQ